MTILDNPDTVGNLVSRYGSEHQQEKISDTTMAEASKNIQLSENASPYTNLQIKKDGSESSAQPVGIGAAQVLEQMGD